MTHCCLQIFSLPLFKNGCTKYPAHHCPADVLTGEKKGKMRIIGRVAGQMIETMYALLKTDAEVLSQVSPRAIPPAPILYDPEVHRSHRAGHYRPMKSSPPPNRIILLPKSP